MESESSPKRAKARASAERNMTRVSVSAVIMGAAVGAGLNLHPLLPRPCMTTRRGSAQGTRRGAVLTEVKVPRPVGRVL